MLLAVFGFAYCGGLGFEMYLVRAMGPKVFTLD
jgi:hypothetical protein